MLISSHHIAYRTIRLKLCQESSPYTIRIAHSPILSSNALRNGLIRCLIKALFKNWRPPPQPYFYSPLSWEEGWGSAITIEDLIMLLSRTNTHSRSSVRYLMPYIVPNSIQSLILLPCLTGFVLLKVISGLQYLLPALGFMRY
jgi:hypothetical protein